MGIGYLCNCPWSSWTRDERYFCSVLYAHASQDPSDFAAWLNTTAGLGLSTSGDWDLGYEVCFYRDFCWQTASESASKRGLPAKRTFDLCLFGEHAIVVIEAKVCEGFSSDQNDDFGHDAKRIQSLLAPLAPDVKIVALATSTYFENAHKHGRRGDDEIPRVLKPFDGHLTWALLADRYQDEQLAQAEWMYGMKPGALLGPV